MADRMEMEPGVHGSKMMAKCPICEKYHKVTIFWTGRGVPRINCDWCRHNVVAFAGDIDGDQAGMAGYSKYNYRLDNVQ